MEALLVHQDGKDFIAETHGARNIKQLRMFFALCEILADNDTKCSTKDIAKQNLLWALNYVDLWVDRSNKVHVQTKSIAFESMTQEEFNQFFQRAIELVCQWLGSAPEEIRQRVADITDPTKGYTIK